MKEEFTVFTIGCHLSISKGFSSAARDAMDIGANTFQFFTRNPRGGRAKNLSEDELNDFKNFCTGNNLGVIVAHAPYTLNLCSSDEKVVDFGIRAMTEDLIRLNSMPPSFYNFHPGSHTGKGVDKGIEMISNALNKVLITDMKTKVLLETMAGKGSEVGSKFIELKQIIDRVNLKDKIGVCLDTCHVYDAGYDIVNDLDGVLKEFDDIIGLQRLCAIHINDSKNPYASKKDRHEKLGEGYIGLDAMERIINHKYLRSHPFILETPNDTLKGYANEISILKGLRK